MIAPGSYHATVYGCLNGKTEVLLVYSSIDGLRSRPFLHAAPDMDLNGIPEVIVTYYATTGENLVVDVLEWNGAEFQSYIKYFHGEDSESTSRLAKALYWYEVGYYSFDFYGDDDHSRPSMNGPGDFQVYDTDHNGTKELVLTDNGPGHPDTLDNFGPWRGQKLVFKWDGLHYLYSSIELDPPQYRFQAVQDADRLFFMGEYDQALELYRKAIYSQTLDFWSQEKKIYLRDLRISRSSGDPTPTPPPPDPDEYIRFAAYARYRIVLHHLARGWVSDAEAVYQTLLKQNLEGTVGYPYVEMATLLWNTYQEEPDLALACEPVIEYARAHKESIHSLGDISRGLQSHWYEPEDVCPFVWEFE